MDFADKFIKMNEDDCGAACSDASAGSSGGLSSSDFSDFVPQKAITMKKYSKKNPYSKSKPINESVELGISNDDAEENAKIRFLEKKVDDFIKDYKESFFVAIRCDNGDKYFSYVGTNRYAGKNFVDYVVNSFVSTSGISFDEKTFTFTNNDTKETCTLGIVTDINDLYDALLAISDYEDLLYAEDVELCLTDGARFEPELFDNFVEPVKQLRVGE